MRHLFATFSAVVAETQEATRSIVGVMVPHAETARLMVAGEMRDVRFAPGSLVPARARTPLVLGHDLDAPIGVMAGMDAGEDVTRGRFAIDNTPAGTDALTQAASGSRGGLSVGALLTEYADAADGTLEVTEAQVYHVGLVPIPAFAGADVLEVAAAFAQNPNERNGNMAPEPVATPPAPEPAVTPTPAPAPVAAAAEVPVVHVIAEHTPPAAQPGDAGALVLAMLRAQNGDTTARAYVEAALSVLDSTDVPGLMPPQYVGSVLGEITVARPLAQRVAVTRPMPATGMEFSKPKWDTLPNGGWVAENAAIPSNAPAVGTQDVTILEWAYGVAMSYAVANRSSPDAIEAIYRAAVQDYYSDVEQKIADLLMASDSPTAAGASLGAAVAGYFGAVNRTAPNPNLLVVAPDVYGDLFDALVMVPATQGTSGVGADFRGTIGGLEVVVSPHLPAGTEIVTSRGAVELRETNPVRLTANVIGALQVELGVTAFASFDLELPGGVISLTPPAGAPAGSSSAKRSTSKQKAA